MCLDSNLTGGIGINKSLIKAKDIEASKEKKQYVDSWNLQSTKLSRFFSSQARNCITVQIKNKALQWLIEKNLKFMNCKVQVDKLITRKSCV